MRNRCTSQIRFLNKQRLLPPVCVWADARYAHRRGKTIENEGIQTAQLHLLRLLLVLPIILILIIIVFVFLAIRRGGARGCLRIVLGLLGSCLDFGEFLPCLRKGVCFRNIISDNNVVKNSSAFDLPQVEAEEAEVGILVDRVIIHVLRIGDLLSLPDALVSRVGDTLDIPITLVLGIVLHRSLPLPISLVIPIVRLLRITVYDALVLDPVAGLLVLGIIDHRVVGPIR